jgi:hypothetical protein
MHHRQPQEIHMTSRTLAALTVVGFALAFGATAGAQSNYKKDLPDSLVRRAKVTESAAAAVAQKRVPKGAINAVELEQENGRLIYSYELKVPGKRGIEEVNVNALTGKIVGGVEHESGAAEAKEAAAEAKTAKSKPKKP